MTEIAIDIIFWIGYLVAFLAMVLLLIALGWKIVHAVLNIEKVFYSVMNNTFDKRLGNITDEQFQDWIRNITAKRNKIRAEK